MENTHQYTSGEKRYSESLLREGDEVLLIGYTDAKGGVPFLRKDDKYKLLGITLDPLSIFGTNTNPYCGLSYLHVLLLFH